MKYLRIILLLFCVGLVCRPGSAFAQGGKKKKKDKSTETAQAGSSNLSKKDVARIESLLLDAEKAKITEDWDAAIKAYQDVLNIDSKNADAHFQIASIYSDQNKNSDAEREALAAVKYDGTNKWYWELLAGIYLAEGKAKEGLDTYKTMMDKFPNNPEYYLNEAFIFSKLGQYENAIKVYDQFEKNFGIDEQVIEEKKNLYLHLNKFNEAVNEAHKLVEAFPGETDYMIQEAELYRLKKMNDKAKEIYNQVLKLEPDNPQAQLGLAQLGIQSGDNAQKKENLVSIFENPKVSIDTKVGVLLISYIQMNSGDSAKRKEALELAAILRRVHPDDAKAYAISGDLYYMDKQDDAALEQYKKALELNKDKDVLQVWQQVLLIYNQKGDWNNLLKTANDAVELFPNSAVIYLFKGTAENQLKDYDKAVKSFTRGEKMSVENDKLRAQFLANLGDVYHSLNKNTESDTAYEQSLKLDPDNAYVLNNYSYYLSMRKQNLERAKQMSAYANKLEPNNSSFLDTYAWILFQTGDFKDAKDWQEKALAAGGDKSGTELEHYGDILFKLGKKEEALNYWKKAKEMGTDSETIDKKIQEQKYVE